MPKWDMRAYKQCKYYTYYVSFTVIS